MIGTKYGKVEIIDYHPAWAEKFEQEKTILHDALRDDVIKIEHIGSTAIVNMAAKPTLDIIVGLKKLNSPEYYLPTLQEIGYEFRPNHPVSGRLHFAKIVQKIRTHNLSLTKYGSRFWENHILFRDYLRQHSSEASAYEEIKKRLAKEYPENTVRYTEGKNEFIEQVLQKARK